MRSPILNSAFHSKSHSIVLNLLSSAAPLLLAFSLAPSAIALCTVQSDVCATATPITGFGSFAFDLTQSTNSDSGCWQGQRDVYWSWTAPTSGDYLVALSWPAPHVEFTATLGVYEQPLCSLTNRLGCEIGANTKNGVLIPGAQAGASYLIQVGGFDSGTGVMDIGQAPCTPPNFTDDAFEQNDSLAQATPLVPGTYASLFVVAGDPDFYSVVIPPFQNISVQTNLETPGRLTMFDSNGAAIQPQFQRTWGYLDPQSPTPTTVFFGISKEGGTFERSFCQNYDMTVVLSPSDSRFESFCNPSNQHSAGGSTILTGYESHPQWGSRIYLNAINGPDGQFGYFLVGSQALDPGIALGQGSLCLGGPIGRYNEQGRATNSLGYFGGFGSFENISGTGFFFEGFIPPTELPNGMGTIQAGSRWHFQLWHRDIGGNSNLSNGVSIQF